MMGLFWNNYPLVILNEKVDQKGVAPKTPYFARGKRNVTMVYNKTRFASPNLKNFMVNLGLV